MVYAIEWSARGRGGRVEFTSASANKYLRRLQDEKDRLLRNEQEVSTYVLAEGRRPSLPPTTTGPCARRSRRSTGRRGPFATPCTDSTCRRFARARHHHRRGPHPARTAVGAQGATERLASRQPKERLGDRYFGGGSGPIEYRYANYDVARAEADYRAVADEIAALQLELDLVNQTEVFSVEL